MLDVKYEVQANLLESIGSRSSLSEVTECAVPNDLLELETYSVLPSGVTIGSVYLDSLLVVPRDQDSELVSWLNSQ